MTHKYNQPPFLQAGDTVAIVAPSGVLNNRELVINKAKQLLNSWGLSVILGKHLYRKQGHFAGTDQERALDLQQVLDNPSIKAIWCARGGYGAIRILDRLDYTAFKKNPKWLIGFSDITALHNQIHNLGYMSLHAIMCTSLEDDPEDNKESISTLKNSLFGRHNSYSTLPSKYNKVGSATGVLVGGNLTMLHSLLGSTTSIDTTHKILFIEEIGEYAYHIDRMLQSLKRAGYFEGCQGLLIGDITKIRKNTTPFGRTIEELILDVVKDCQFPVLFNVPVGHTPDNRALIIGKTIQIDVTKQGGTLNYID